MKDLLIACEKPTLTKQVHSFVGKTSSNKIKLYVNSTMYAADDDRTVENVSVFQKRKI